MNDMVTVQQGEVLPPLLMSDRMHELCALCVRTWQDAFDRCRELGEIYAELKGRIETTAEGEPWSGSFKAFLSDDRVREQYKMHGYRAAMRFIQIVEASDPELEWLEQKEARLLSDHRTRGGNGAPRGTDKRIQPAPQPKSEETEPVIHVVEPSPPPASPGGGFAGGGAIPTGGQTWQDVMKVITRLGPKQQETLFAKLVEHFPDEIRAAHLATLAPHRA